MRKYPEGNSPKSSRSDSPEEEIMSLPGYSQGTLTFLDAEDHFGADTQTSEFDYTDFTLPSQVINVYLSTSMRTTLIIPAR